MAGSSIFDYVHQKDHQELSEQLGLVAPSGNGAAPEMPSPGSASDDGSSSNNNNTSSRPQTPPIPERGEHYCKSLLLHPILTEMRSHERIATSSCEFFFCEKKIDLPSLRKIRI